MHLVKQVDIITLLCQNDCVGTPTLVRADKGTENARVAYLQPFLRRNDTDTLAGNASFRYGKSVNNQVGNQFTQICCLNSVDHWQRIEALWSMIRKWCLDWWIDFFRQLRDEGHYNETNPIQV